MYFRRVRKLDVPELIQKKLLQEWESGTVIPTSRSGPDHIAGSNFQLTVVAAYRPSTTLEQEIYAHYQDFLNLVPDEPKIFIKKILSGGSYIPPHSDKSQTASIQCVIKTDTNVLTSWHEPNANVAHLYQTTDNARYKNTKGIDKLPLSHSSMITGVRMAPWEMVLFDHNAFHSVEFVPNMERVLFSIGFLNITETELEDIYDQWWTQQ